MPRSNHGEESLADGMHLRGLQEPEKLLVPEDQDAPASVGTSGSVSDTQTKHKQPKCEDSMFSANQEIMHRLDLQKAERLLGPEHPDTLSSISNLAVVMRTPGDFEQAEAIYRRALQGRERVLGPEHQHTLDIISSLGSVFNAQCRYKGAEDMHRRALVGRENALGPDHRKP